MKALGAVLAFAMALLAGVATAQNSSVPYTLAFVPVSSASLPPLHSYCIADISAGQWLVFGGRYQNGLHTFNPSDNFQGPNTFLWSINPQTGTAQKVADLSQLNPNVGNPLTSTNQQCEYDPDTGYWYAIGGYGVARPGTGFQTFNTVTRLPVPQLLAIINNTSMQPEDMQSAVIALLNNPSNQVTNTSLQVTGGVLSRLANGMRLLSFGQVFTGSYNPFTSSPGFTQTYTQQVVQFTLSPCNAGDNSCALTVNVLGTTTSNDADHPYNRRDFPSVYDIDPADGQDRFTLFGGVFKPGAIAAYDYPVRIKQTTAGASILPDHTLQQHFGFYEQPVIVVWDGTQTYFTFFGGISHFFLHQTAAQSQVYKLVSGEGRNDGMPFVEDIGLLVENASHQYQEFVAPQTVPGNNLDGSSVQFIVNQGMTRKFQGIEGSVVSLQTFIPNEAALIGYIYGGIEAQFPLPCEPSHGTQAVGTLYRVVLTRTPWQGLVPASQMTEANGYFKHRADAKKGEKAKVDKETRAAVRRYGSNPCETMLRRHAE